MACPALVEMLLIQAVSIINMAMVGHLGPAALASVGVANSPLYVALSIFVALNVGTSAMVARAIGAGDKTKARDVAIQALAMTAVLSVMVGAIGLLFADSAMALMKPAPDVARLGASYLRLMSISMIFGTFSTCSSSILRGAGDTRTPMFINMATDIIVLGCNLVFIYGRFGVPALGVLGCGVSAIIARAVGVGAFTFSMLSGATPLSLRGAGRFRVRKELLAPVLKIGLPSAGEQFMLQTGLAIFARMVTGLGTEAFAAHQVAANILGLSFMPGQAFAMASSTLVGQRLGAESPGEAEEAAKETRRIGFVFASIMALVFFTIPHQLSALFTKDAAVVAMAAGVLRIVAFIQPMQSAQFIIAGGLRGAGDTKVPLYSTTISVWIIRLSVAYVLVQICGLGLTGAWLAFAVDQLFRWSFITFRFNSGLWKEIKVVGV